MTDRQLLISLAASLSIHLALVPIASRLFNSKQSAVLPLPIQLVEVPRIKQVEESEATPPETLPKPKPEKIIAPRLLSKPQILEGRAPTRASNAKEQTKELEKLEHEEKSRSFDLPETPGAPKGGWNIGSKPGEAEGSVAGGASLVPNGDTNAATGVVTQGGGEGSSGSGRSAKGDGSGGGTDVRPLASHQVKPRYPDSARRARAQGTTVLKFRVLTSGKVADVFIEKSAGRRDLDEAALDAVKKWLFEPARVGKEPVSVWVILPVEFKLY